jgi:ubiquinol-cytochrome c reductase cytochrome c1 subunit
MQFSSPKSLRQGLVVAVLAAGLALSATAAFAARTFEEPVAPRTGQGFHFDGPLQNHYTDKGQAQLQRGYKVYHEVCSSCHGMKLLHFRDLGAQGGPFWDPKYPDKPNDNPVVKAIAADFQISDVDTSTGDIIKRKGIPADPMPSPYPNDYAAANSNGGAVPPDQSDLAKAREGGAEYIYSILTGYRDAPAGLKITGTQHYNPWMPGDVTSYWTGDPKHVPKGGFIAMPPPLKDGLVKFDDGTKSTVDQEAQDVAAFLDWASDPHAGERKQTGIAVMAYLLLLAGLCYLSYRRIWRNVSH